MYIEKGGADKSQDKWEGKIYLKESGNKWMVIKAKVGTFNYVYTACRVYVLRIPDGKECQGFILSPTFKPV